METETGVFPESGEPVRPGTGIAVLLAEAKSSGRKVTPAVAAASAAFWIRETSTYQRATSTEMAHRGIMIVAAKAATSTAAYPRSSRVRDWRRPTHPIMSGHRA